MDPRQQLTGESYKKQSFKVSVNYPEGIERMKKHAFKKIFSILVRTATVCGISTTICSITTPVLWKSTWYALIWAGVVKEMGAPSRGYSFVPGGAGCQHFSPLLPHQPQLYFRQATAERTRLPLPHPAPIHRVENLSQVWQALNTGALITPSPAISYSRSSTPGVVNWEDQRLSP